MDRHRLQRVAHLLRVELSDMIMKQKIKDPRVSSMVSISDIQVSRDLSYAKVFVSSFEDHARLQSAVEGLNSAAGFIQSQVGKKIRLRSTPKLTFIVDHAIEKGFQITEKLKDAMS